MEALQNGWNALISGEAFAFSGVGVVVAAAMLVSLRRLLPKAEQGRLKPPTAALVGYLVLVLVVAFSGPDSGVHRAAKGFAGLLLLVSLARTGFLLVVDNLLVRRFSRPIPKIFRDIGEGLVYSAVVLATLRQAGAQLDALLTTSALLTAVVGLSLQDTLGNLFAGLSIQAQNPFEVGDWIQYGGNEADIGRVIEINWRATKVVTLDNIEVIIPNGPLARAPIRNFTKPTNVSRRNLYVTVPFSQAPHRVRAAIVDGLTETEGVLESPEPTVVTQEFGERGVRYWVRYYTQDFEQREFTDGLARDRIWYALRRAGIRMAVPVADLEVSYDDESARQREHTEALERRETMLRGVDFLEVLSESQIRSLAQHASERPYAPGEFIIREGDGGDEFFIVQRGDVSVLLGVDESEVEVARLDAGTFFGEMSVMTGEPRTASVRALQDTQLLVIDKACLRPLLESSPELAERISEVLAARQLQLDSASSKTQAKQVAVARQQDERNELLFRIKEFFSLSN